MEQFLLALIFQIFGIAFRVMWFVLRGMVWLLWQVGSLFAVSVNRQDILILGPGEQLKPKINYQELFDYSQTSSATELQSVAGGSSQNGDFWLGRHVELSGSKARLSQNIWLPKSFLYQHVLIVGPTGSGKTEFLLKSIPTLMQQGNVVCVDAAGFLSDRLAAFAPQAGTKLGCWDLSTKRHRIVWNFLEELEKFGTEKEIRAVAEALYGNFSEDDRNAPFWQRDIVWLSAILGVAVAARKQKLVQFNPSDLPALVADRQGVEALLNHLPNAAVQWQADLYSYLNLPDTSFGTDIGFLQNKLSPFQDKNVKLICDGYSDIFLLPALNGNQKHTLVIGQSLADGRFGSALAGIIIRYISNVMYRRMRNPNHAWTPTYIICDEAPRLQNIDYEEFTAIGRNASASVFIICQSLDQFSEKTFAALNNCRTQIFLQGVSHKSSEWLSQQLGEYQRRITTVSHNNVVMPMAGGRKQVNYERVPVLGIRELSSRPLGKLPSGLSAIVRINTAQTPTHKPFLTDYSS